jgi:hypothetical protein
VGFARTVRYASQLRNSTARPGAVHAAKVGEDFAVDPLPERALRAAAALMPAVHISTARAVDSSGFLPAFLRGRNAARNARTMRSSVARSGTPKRLRICAAPRVIARYQDSLGKPSLPSAASFARVRAIKVISFLVSTSRKGQSRESTGGRALDVRIIVVK